jgi:glutaredoxin
MDAAVSRRERRVAQRHEREGHVEQQRMRFRRRERNKRILNYTILILLAAGLAYAAYAVVRERNAPGEYDDLARCITQSGAVMYGTDWCPHCQEQKRLFGPSFKLINYINCDLNAQACELAGVEGYPTWVFADGTKASGEQDFAALAARTGCADGS